MASFGLEKLRQSSLIRMLNSHRLRESYDKIYSELGVHADDPGFYRWIATLLNPLEGQKLLDVACGEGGLLYEVLGEGAVVYGLDISPVAVERAKDAVEPSEIVVGEAEALPWINGYFDVVTCLGSLENMLNPWKAISEIVRVVKTGGFVCVQMPNIYWLGDVIEAVYRQDVPPIFQEVNRWATRPAWRVFLQENGLEIERELRYNKPAQLFRAGKLRSLRKFLVRSFLNMITPFNLSWSFVYICKKPGYAALPKSPDYMLYEARQLQFRPGRIIPDD